MIDGEAVVLGEAGISDFAALHGAKRNAEGSMLFLVDEGVDMRDEILGNPQAVLGKLLKRSADGIVHTTTTMTPTRSGRSYSVERA